MPHSRVVVETLYTQGRGAVAEPRYRLTMTTCGLERRVRDAETQFPKGPGHLEGPMRSMGEIGPQEAEMLYCLAKLGLRDPCLAKAFRARKH